MAAARIKRIQKTSHFDPSRWASRNAPQTALLVANCQRQRLSRGLNVEAPGRSRRTVRCVLMSTFFPWTVRSGCDGPIHRQPSAVREPEKSENLRVGSGLNGMVDWR